MDQNLMPWALIAALFTSTILVGTKIFDYYHHRSANDIKLYIDIEKVMKETGHDEKDVSFIRDISKKKISILKKQEKNNTILEKYYPKSNKCYKTICVLGLTLLLFGLLSVVIEITFKLIHENTEPEFPVIGIALISLGLIADRVIELIDYKVRKKVEAGY